jgi:cyclase
MPTIKCGTERVDMPLESFITHIQELGVGEILLTAVHKDGTRAGYDRILIKKVKEVSKVPLIANGGCAGFNDMAEALAAGADAVAASSMFLFTSLTPMNCSFYLDNHGFPARVENGRHRDSA